MIKLLLVLFCLLVCSVVSDLIFGLIFVWLEHSLLAAVPVLLSSWCLSEAFRRGWRKGVRGAEETDLSSLLLCFLCRV